MIGDAAKAGVARAKAAGSIQPLVVFAGDVSAKAEQFDQACCVGVLGALEATYCHIQHREHVGESAAEPVIAVGVCWLGECPGDDPAAYCKAQSELAAALEQGRRVARDICGGDPERMAPPRVADYCEEAFKGAKGVKVSVEADQAKIAKEYPLLDAVNRCSVERHRARIVELEYTGEGPIERTVYVVGKGVTYDTGGADIKYGGIMAGMSRDKGGAAAAAGLIMSLSHLQPKGIRVVSLLGMVRNSVGAECYVADEVITGHSGKRILVVNTDAEGRMVKADLLSLARTRVLEESKGEAPAPGSVIVHSVATLTGHAVVAYGNYTSVNGNGPAVRLGLPTGIQAAGQAFGDCCEVSTLRREDYRFVAARRPHYDVLQCNSAPSSRTPRGHQFPMAFLSCASGLVDHGVDSKVPIPYCHLDIAGSANVGDVATGYETGAAVVALTAHYAGLASGVASSGASASGAATGGAGR